MQRRELLTESKLQLIKRCKLAKLASNGTKADLVNRLMSFNNKNSSKKKNKKVNNKNINKNKNKNKKKSSKKKTISKLSNKKHNNSNKKAKIKKKSKKKNINSKSSKKNKNKSNNNVKKKMKTKTKNQNKIIHKTNFNSVLYPTNNNNIDNVDDPNCNDDNSSLSSLSNQSNNTLKKHLTDSDNDDNVYAIDQSNSSSSSRSPSLSALSTLSTVNPRINISNPTAPIHRITRIKPLPPPRPFHPPRIIESKQSLLIVAPIDINIITEFEDRNINKILSPSNQLLTPTKQPTSHSKTPKIPNKIQIVNDLKNMNFSMDRILRAFKVYEKNYGTNYNISGLIELIKRLIKKDQDKHLQNDDDIKDDDEKTKVIEYVYKSCNHPIGHKRSSSVGLNGKTITTRLYVEHMQLNYAVNLCLFDNIDHRDFCGKFCVATIIEIDTNNCSNLKIHYEDDINDKYDVWSDYKKELFRFAKYRSISRRKQHLLIDEIKIGDHININPHKFYLSGSCNKKLKWIDSIIHKFDAKSGQIQVLHQNKIKINKNDTNWYALWIHIDNIKEISKHSANSVFPSSFYKFTQHQKNSASMGAVNMLNVII